VLIYATANATQGIPTLDFVSIAISANSDSAVLTFSGDQMLSVQSIKVSMGGAEVESKNIARSSIGPKQLFTASQRFSEMGNGNVKFEIRFANSAGIAGVPVSATTDNSKVVSGVYTCRCETCRTSR